MIILKIPFYKSKKSYKFSELSDVGTQYSYSPEPENIIDPRIEADFSSFEDQNLIYNFQNEPEVTEFDQINPAKFDNKSLQREWNDCIA